MKINVVCILFILNVLWINTKVCAQTQLPNSNFEDWTKASNGTDSLKHWSSTNAVIIQPIKSLYLNRDTMNNNNQGILATAPFGFVQWNVVGILANGKARFSYDGGGGVLRGGTRYVGGGGTPISINPKRLTGKYRYEVIAENADKGVVEVTTTKYNATKNKRDTIGMGKTFFPIRKNFTDFTVQINELISGIAPDSITTIFYSSDIETVAFNNTFSSLYIDDLTLLTTTPTHEKEEILATLQISPNPNNGFFTIEFKNSIQLNDELIVSNLLGQIIRRIDLKNNEKNTHITIENLNNGTYFIQSKLKSFKTQKVIVVN
jgi:hypothetical protein